MPKRKRSPSPEPSTSRRFSVGPLTFAAGAWVPVRQTAGERIIAYVAASRVCNAQKYDAARAAGCEPPRMKGRIRPDGYVIYNLGHSKLRLEHRLRAAAAVNASLDDLYGWHVDYIDGHKGNNAASNLQLLTPAEHARKTHADNPHIASAGAPLRSRAVQQLDDHWRVIQEFSSFHEAARVTGVGAGGISQAVTMRCRAGAWYWRATNNPPAHLAEAYATARRWLPLRLADGCYVSGYEVFDNMLLRTRKGVITQGTRTPQGYWIWRVAGQHYFSHVVLFATFHGPIPTNVVVMHQDDDRNNVTVEHLRLGTQQDNVREARATKVCVSKDGSTTLQPTITTAAQVVGLSPSRLATLLRISTDRVTHAGWQCWTAVAPPATAVR
jgi:hypothetical protein